MPGIELQDLIVAGAAALGAGGIVLLLSLLTPARAQRVPAVAGSPDPSGNPIAFLFEAETLCDATPEAERMLSQALIPDENDWERLATLLRHRFPGFDEAMRRLPRAGRVEIAATTGLPDVLRAEWLDGITRVEIAPQSTDVAESGIQQRIAALEAELAITSDLLRLLPAAAWRQSADGTVTWANDAYFALVEEYAAPETVGSWPPPPIFNLTQAEISGGAHVRTSLRGPDGSPDRWFDCQSFPSQSDTAVFAMPSDEQVRVEEALREFVQTLSKTFAHLPIGLAIFDRARRLALFNPALSDLTTLDFPFLSGRPTLLAFLDRLRDNRRMPEQRDYRAWRAKMTALESAAAGGFVQEKWTLPTGQTWRVTGRPHPDGAVAFLFEDITAEISLTRRFRQDLELGQTVLDSLPDAIAVFSSHGMLSLTNVAYARLWGSDPSSTLAEIGIVEATRQWQSASEPTPVWGDVRDFLADRGERAEWASTVRLKDGRIIACRFLPLPGNATLIAFAELDSLDEDTPSLAPPQTADLPIPLR